MTLSEEVQRMWDADLASQTLGMRLVEVAQGHAVVEMPVRPDFVNGHGIGHGGLTFCVADTAFAFACNADRPVTVAAGADVRFVSPVSAGETLVATAQERSREHGRGVYDVEVRAGNRVVARFTGHASELTR